MTDLSAGGIVPDSLYDTGMELPEAPPGASQVSKPGLYGRFKALPTSSKIQIFAALAVLISVGLQIASQFTSGLKLNTTALAITSSIAIGAKLTTMLWQKFCPPVPKGEEVPPMSMATKVMVLAGLLLLSTLALQVVQLLGKAGGVNANVVEWISEAALAGLVTSLLVATVNAPPAEPKTHKLGDISEPHPSTLRRRVAALPPSIKLLLGVALAILVNLGLKMLSQMGIQQLNFTAITIASSVGLVALVSAMLWGHLGPPPEAEVQPPKPDHLLAL